MKSPSLPTSCSTFLQPTPPLSPINWGYFPRSCSLPPRSLPFLWTKRLQMCPSSYGLDVSIRTHQYQPIPVGSTSMCIYVDGDFISIPLSMIYIYSTVNPRINQTHHQKWLGFKPFPNWSRLFGFPTLLGGFNKPPLPDQRHTPPGKLRVLSTENL